MTFKSECEDCDYYLDGECFEYSQCEPFPYSDFCLKKDKNEQASVLVDDEFILEHDHTMDY